MNQRTILNMLMGNKDPREEEYRRWLQSQGRGGVPIREDYGAFDPSLSYDVQQEFDQEGYDEAMGEYDWKRKLKDMQNKRFYASLANVFAPRYPEQPRAMATGPSSRPFPDYMPMRYWS